MIPYIELDLIEAESRLDLDSDLFVDTETIGLYGRIRLVQLYQKNIEAVILVNNPDPFYLASILNKFNNVMHNSHYDITTVQDNLGAYWAPERVEDTLYLARLEFYNKEKFSLDDVMGYVLGYDPYDKAGIDKKAMQKSNWDVPILTTNQKLYAAIDVYFLPDVFDAVKNQCDCTSYKIDMLALKYALKFQRNGMPVIRDAVQEAYSNNIAQIESFNLPINVNSYQQVRPYIGSVQSDDLGLATLALEGNMRAKEVRKVRKLIKQNSFLNKFDTNEGRIYGKFLPSARSGRFTSKDQNLQQIPRKLKKVFGFNTEDGKVLVYSDYAQLEMRCITAITGEQRMEALLREGGDLHDFTAAMLFGSDFTKIQRQISKTANFGLLYGAGVNVFLSILIKEADLLLTHVEGSSTKKKWRNLYSSISRWQDSGIAAQRRGQAWQTPFGRRYTAKMMTDQLNIQNQGFGSEVAKLAMHYMMPIIENDWADKGVKLVNFVHDSYIFECPAEPEIYEAVADVVSDAMQRAWFEACRVGIDLKIRDLPMPVDVFVGYNWGRIEDDYIYKTTLEGMKTYELL